MKLGQLRNFCTHALDPPFLLEDRNAPKQVAYWLKVGVKTNVAQTRHPVDQLPGLDQAAQRSW